MNFFRAISNLLRFDRTNWTALVLCLFVATIFWIFSALNKTYSTNISFPLSFEFDGTRYAAAETLPANLNVNVSGIGWELLRKKVGLKVPTISYPLERPGEVRKIVGSTLSPHVVSQLGALQLNFIVLDTIRVHIEQRVSRKVKLLADLNKLTFKKNFGIISPVVILPDTVLLEGPKSYIDNLPDTLMIEVRANRIDSHFREIAEVKVDYNEFISRNPPVAEVLFEVGLMEEITTVVKLIKPKSSAGLEVDLDSVQCTLLIPQQEHSRFLTDALEISATFKALEIKSGDTLLVKPILTGLPVYARLVRADSITLRKR